MSKLLIESVSNGGAVIKTRCPICGEIQTVDIKPSEIDGFTQWYNGKALIQNALPNISTSNREKLVSGTCEGCWASMFSNWEG